MNESQQEKYDRLITRVCNHLAHYLLHYPNDWVGIFLQGSQNYDLEYEGSDVDTKIIVLPSLEDIALNKQPISTTLITEDNEHVDVKDIRLMFDCFKKQNINFLEILYTKWFILNPRYEAMFKTVLDYRDRIARYNNYAAMHCMLGMVKNKRAMLTKPHPSAKDVVERYGYDGKQLHHMERILEFFYRYSSGMPYEKCLTAQARDYLISLKRNSMSLEDAVRRADEIVNVMTEAVEAYMMIHECQVDKTVDPVLKNALLEMIKANIINEIEREKKKHET